VIIDLQRRIAEIGRIRIGRQVATSNGKTRPAKLDTFRLTSADKTRIDQAAALYGGTPAEWEAPAGHQWEVITAADSLDVIVPPSDMAFSQWYEMWSAGGCQRRCDGAREQITDGPCLCDPDDRDCDIHTRLSVMLSDLPGLGVWRIDTSGYYAAVEMSGAVQVVQTAAGRGSLLPARLRLEQRVVKRPGADGKPETRRFAVPVLDIDVTPAQLLAAPRGPAGEIGGAPARPGLTPVPALTVGPGQTIAEQVVPPRPTPPRSNAAPAIPASGRRRDTSRPPVNESDVKITDKTRGHMFALFTEFGLDETQQKVGIGRILNLGGPIASRADLTEDQALIVVADLERRKAALDEPTVDEPPLDDQTFDAAGRPVSHG